MSTFTAGPGTTYLLTSTQPLPSGTANGVLYLNGSKVVTSGSGLVFDSSGNLGLGVTPSAWGAPRKSITLLNPGQIVSSSITLEIGANWYHNGTNYIYQSTNPVSLYSPSNGQHAWYTAPSGAAGNTISFTQAMTLNSSGNLLLGTTSDTDNTASYRQVVTLGAGAVAGGGIMVTSNQNVSGGKAFISAVNFNTLTGAYVKPAMFSYIKPTANTSANFQVTGGNFISMADIGAANLNVANQNLYIQNIGFNNTSGEFINSVAYLYVQTSGTTNVNKYTAYHSSYQTAVSNETISTFADFNAAPFRTMSAGSSVTTRYGVLIDFAATNVTNPWGVYQSNASVRNYFAGGAIFSGAALATNATDGFIYVPTCAGTPTGTPTAQTGTAPIVVDTTNNKLYFYSGGQWRDAGP